MPWVRINEQDLIASLSKQELDAFRTSSDFESDPVEKQIAAVVAKVRSHIRASRTATLDPDPMTLPPSVVSDAMDFLRYVILTRHDIPVNESRTKAWESAKETFRDIASGKIKVEDGVEPVPSGSVAVPSISVKPPIL